ncbi:MAG: stress responsive A/B barrel domain-containing protein [Piptocephalis tieghemiana]|nr:MAG: stress responsive A/B barrel domain-containing protein [Piptocephalis tieghemiana]
MPVTHVVLIKFKSTISEESRKEVLAKLEPLRSIPTVRSLKYGSNFSDRSQGYTHGLVAEFDDPSGLSTYDAHTLHQEYVKETLRPAAESILAFDFDPTA